MSSQSSNLSLNHVLKDLQMAEHPCPTPETTHYKKLREWSQAWCHFSNAGFARLLMAAQIDTVVLHLEIALGKLTDNTNALTSFNNFINSHTNERWSIVHSGVPWRLETAITMADSSTTDALNDLLTTLPHIAMLIDNSSDTSALWRLMEMHGAMESPTNHEVKQAPETFELIGDATQDIPSEHRPTTAEILVITESSIECGDAFIDLILGLSQIVPESQLRALAVGLDRHIRIKLDVTTMPLDLADQSHVNDQIPDTETYLGLRLTPSSNDDKGTDLKSLHHALERDIAKLLEFCHMGMSLFDILGVVSDTNTEAETVSTSRTSIDDDSTVTETSGVVFDLGPSNSRNTNRRAEVSSFDTSSALPNYTDPRLMRPDASTALVDVVLRHPGYSDRNIGQVLSILLSIEYHNATRLIESAPCVIAWEISLERAQRFKSVLENSGARVVLVEPGEFHHV